MLCRTPSRADLLIRSLLTGLVARPGGRARVRRPAHKCAVYKYFPTAGQPFRGSFSKKFSSGCDPLPAHEVFYVALVLVADVFDQVTRGI